MDAIVIDEFNLDVQVGTCPREIAFPQRVSLDLEVGISAVAAKSGNLEDTIDYAKLLSRLREALGERRFSLLEELADFVANLILEEFSAERIRVSAAKLGVVREARRVRVVVEREKAQKQVL